MANTKEFRDTKVGSISVSSSTGQFILTVVQESPFAGFADSGVEHNITLFSRRNGEIDDATVARTQDALREQLGDENIVFTDPSERSDDANHIENWVKAHKGSPVALVTQNENGFFDLGEGLTGGGSFGNSSFLKGYQPADGSYDPKQHRVSFYEALSAYQRDAVDSMDASKYPEIQGSSKSSYKGIVVKGIVADVILSRANTFGSTPEKYSREDIREEIIDSLTSGKRTNADNEALAERIEALPEDFAYIDLLRIIGGSSAENVKGTKQGSISGMLDNVDRTSVRFYVQNPETGYVFQTTGFRAGNNAQTIESQNNVQFEFVTDDFSHADLVRFLSNIAGLQGTDFDINKLFEVAVEEGIFNKETGEFQISDMNDLVEALRTWFVGREVDIQSTLYGSRGRQDKDKLGTNIRSVSATKDVDALSSDIITATSGTEVTIGGAPEEVKATAESAPSNPFAAAASAPAEDAPSNPFGVTEEADEVEAEEEVVESPVEVVTAEPAVEAPVATVEEEDEDEEEDLTSNPFI